MAHHAKTFYWANRLMPAEYRRDFAVLYAFCRVADDAVDEAPDAATAARDMAVLEADFASGRGELPVVRDFLVLCERRDIDPAIPLELLKGIRGDIGGVHLQTERALMRYAYRVASTVGLMACSILDVRHSDALAHAIDLGLGMQLTNIARDVVEDYHNDKCYLPADRLDKAILQVAIERRDRHACDAVYQAILQLVQSAQIYYRSADAGMRYLPTWARWGILTASRGYESIGRRIELLGAGYWEQRAFTSARVKAWKTLGSGLALLLKGEYRDIPQPRAHDGQLHRHLDGLPGIHQPPVAP